MNISQIRLAAVRYRNIADRLSKVADSLSEINQEATIVFRGKNKSVSIAEARKEGGK